MKKYFGLKLCAWVTFYIFLIRIGFSETQSVGIEKKNSLNLNASQDVSPKQTSSIKPSNTPAITPLVGEVAAGISLLIAYGPQIITLATTVATLAVAVGFAIHSSKESVIIIKSIGTKLRNMLKLLLGPLTVSSGLTQESLSGLSSHLLSVAKFVSNSISTPVDQIQNKVNLSLSMSRKIENIANKGKSISENIIALSQKTVHEINQNISRKEEQLFRDGVVKVFGRLEKRGNEVLGSFNQTLENARTATRALTSIKDQICSKLLTSKKSASDAELSDIGISRIEISKQLIYARKNLVLSDKILLDSSKSSENLHTELILLLEDIKLELQNFAKYYGVSEAELNRIYDELSKDDERKSVFLPVSKNSSKFEKESFRLSKEISSLLDELEETTDRYNMQIKKTNLDGPSKRKNSKEEKKGFSLRSLYNKKTMAYKQYFSLLTKDPGNTKAIKAAKEKFDLADKAYHSDEE